MADPLYEAVFELQMLVIAYVTGDQNTDEKRFKQLRGALVADQRIAPKLPMFIRTCRDLRSIWAIVKPKFAHYHERRAWVNEQFAPLLNELEFGASPVDREAAEILTRVNLDTVREVWERAQARRADDPDGAITLARTLLETVCKHILHKRDVTFDPKAELPDLYRLTAKTLQIAPDQQTEDAFRRLFGACTSIVESLGTIRSRIGDAHGRAPGEAKAHARHARLAVAMAGSMATFLVETLDAGDV